MDNDIKRIEKVFLFVSPCQHLVICHGQSRVVRKHKRTLPKNQNDEVETYVLIIHLILSWKQSINTETVKGRRNWGKGTDPPHTHTQTTFFQERV